MNRFATLFLALLALTPGVMAASSVVIWPLTQTIPADDKGSVLWLENRGAAPITLQIRVVGWQQQQARESYHAQQNVVPSPPFATIAPGQRQMVRLMSLRPAPSGQEQAYRVIVDEVPGAVPASTEPGAGIHFQMRYLLPLFVAGDGIKLPNAIEGPQDGKSYTQPALSWRVVSEAGQHWLTVSNKGAVHARLSGVFWGSAPNASRAALTMSPGLLGYVLPGQEMRWPIPGGRKPPAGKLFATLAETGQPVEIPSAG
ncbi:pili assembly chaperone [Salmonella enterica subsp. enterica serovar Choleraesuis]|nr:pili assembly chaperone [Salmonella enterica subsp. enterica serovar Choleraesuis]